MSTDDTNSRRGRLRELRQRRSGLPGAERNRGGLKGLFLGPNDQGGETSAATGPAGLGPFLRAPRVRKLLQNPRVRQMLVTWLMRQGELEQGAQPSNDAPNAEDFGFDRLGKTDLLTSSSPEEIRRYIRQLESRADWLEATLEETLMELERVRRFAPSESGGDEASEASTEAGAAEGDAVAAKRAPQRKRVVATKRAAKKKAVRKKVSAKPAPAVDQG